MSANVEFFIKVDRIESIKKDIKEYSKLTGGNYYDRDGKEIDVYYRRHWEIVDHLICLDGKEISLQKLDEIFKSRNSLNMEFSFTNGSEYYLLVSCHAKDIVELSVMIEILKEFLYDMFYKELEF